MKTTNTTAIASISRNALTISLLTPMTAAYVSAVIGYPSPQRGNLCLKLAESFKYHFEDFSQAAAEIFDGLSWRHKSVSESVIREDVAPEGLRPWCGVDMHVVSTQESGDYYLQNEPNALHIAVLESAIHGVNVCHSRPGFHLLNPILYGFSHRRTSAQRPAWLVGVVINAVVPS
jgi:hypothetical protein